MLKSKIERVVLCRRHQRLRRRRQSDQFLGDLAGPAGQHRRSRLLQELQVRSAIARRAGRAGPQPRHRRMDHGDRAQGHRAERRVSRRRRPRASNPPISRISSRPSRSATGAAISMFHRDGTLLARYPHVDELIGQNFRNGPAVQRQIFELPITARSRLTSPIDGEDRLVSSRALTNFPLSDRRTDDGLDRAGRLARADPIPDRGRRPFGAGDRRPAVPDRPQAFAAAPRVAAAADAGEAAPRHRRQQHDAGPVAVRCQRSGSSSATSAISRCTACRRTS